MTRDCLRLDDYLDGRLSEPDAEAFETHSLTCTTCEDALALPDELTAGLASLRDVTCPPEVLEAALRSARRAPDRAPAVRQRATRQRFLLAPLGLAAALALAVGLWWDRAPAPTDAPIAEVVPAVVVEPEPPAPAAPDAEVPATDAAAPAVDEPPAPPSVVPSPVAPSLTPRQISPSAPVAPDPVAQAEPDDAPDDAEPTPAEIEDARQDLALAFQLVAEAQIQARQAVRAEAGPLTSTIDQALPF